MARTTLFGSLACLSSLTMPLPCSSSQHSSLQESVLHLSRYPAAICCYRTFFPLFDRILVGVVHLSVLSLLLKGEKELLCRRSDDSELLCWVSFFLVRKLLFGKALFNILSPGKPRLEVEVSTELKCRSIFNKKHFSIILVFASYFFN